MLGYVSPRADSILAVQGLGTHALGLAGSAAQRGISHPSTLPCDVPDPCDETGPGNNFATFTYSTIVSSSRKSFGGRSCQPLWACTLCSWLTAEGFWGARGREGKPAAAQPTLCNRTSL